MELGSIGLGKMGSSLALNAVDNEITVIGKDVGKKSELEKNGVNVVTDYKQFADNLKTPRIIYISLPAGPVIDKVLDELLPHLDRGDVIMDGGNSFFRDSVRREKELSKKGFLFLDCSTSGGVDGARNGACFMVGGKDEGIKLAEPILKKLAVDEGYVHTGVPGSGHFVKLVHNGIEFGMLQSIGEGVTLMESGEFDLNLVEIFKNWSHGSVIRSWLIELMEAGLRQQKGLDKIPEHIEDTGEVNWLIHEALNKEVSIPVITQSIMELFKSREKYSTSAKAVALMHHGFGGHPFGPDEYITKERKTSRIKKV